MNKIKPRTLSGFMELLPPDQVCFDTMMLNLRKSFSLYGFTPLDTPLMEASEILLAKGGGETEKQIYTLRKGDNDLAVRYELTASLAKYAALYYNDLTFPLRRYEIGKVYRGERAQRGRFREFYQADIDIIGDGSLDLMNEAEIPGVIYKSLTSLGLKRFIIKINNRKILNGFFEILGINELSTEVMRVVDKLDKIGEKKLSETLIDALGLTQTQVDGLLGFITNKTEPFGALDLYKGKNETFDQGTEEIITLRKYLSDLGVPETHYKIDLSIARGLDYYTGTVYETYLTDYPEVGAICSGGRYDNLAEHYTDRKMPGVGLSIGLTRLFYILQEQGLLNDSLLTAPADVLIIPMTEECSHAVKLATTMRESGLRVQIYSENKKFKNKISYADKLGIPFVVFLGEDEISKGLIKVKDMATGEQTIASYGILTAGILDKIKTQRKGEPVKEK
ncbi:MAG: histidine--tRNA ligase [Oscillospiraceae bacterium]|nr:histidine--tRNA ligase [Oscillospiraceae bacterium]